MNKEGHFSGRMSAVYGSHLFHALILAGVVFLIYSNTYRSPFLFDDVDNIVNNPVIRDFSYFLDPSKAEQTFAEFNTPIFRTRWVGYLTFALNFAMGGLDVRGYHLVNTLIHLGNALLMYWLLSLLFKSPYFLRHDGGQQGPTGGHPFIVVFSALLFAVHPMQTQAVTYIVQRFASLAALFYLLSIAFYLKFRLSALEGAGKGFSVKGTSLYATALLSAVLAMKTKEFSVSLPVTLALMEFMFFDGAARRRTLYLVPFVLSTLLIPLSLVGMNSGTALGGGLSDAAANISGASGTISRGDYLMTQFPVMVAYLRLLFFPAGQNVDHDFPVYTSFLSPAVLLSFLLISFLVGLGIYLHRYSGAVRTGEASRLRLIALGIFWFFVTLAPESSIVPIEDVMFEHRVYLPSAGFFIALTASLEFLGGKWKGGGQAVRTLSYGMLVLAVGLAAAAYARNRVWADDVSLWEDAVRKSPNKARLHTNLGVAYQKRGWTDQSILEYEAAQRIKPNGPLEHINLGVAYQRKGMVDQAIHEYQAALKINPNIVNAHINLGVAYQKKGLIDQAISSYQAALNIDPNDAYARNGLGNAYEKRGQLDRAIEEYQAALRLRPDFAQAHYNLGSAYANAGRLREAVYELQEAVRLNPQDAFARMTLERVVEKARRMNP